MKFSHEKSPISVAGCHFKGPVALRRRFRRVLLLSLETSNGYYIQLHCKYKICKCNRQVLFCTFLGDFTRFSRKCGICGDFVPNVSDCDNDMGIYGLQGRGFVRKMGGKVRDEEAFTGLRRYRSPHLIASSRSKKECR